MIQQTITSWSYSRYSTWKQCPGKAKLLYIEKLKEPDSPALLNGQKKHTELEYFLKGYSPLPDWVHKNSKPYAEGLKERKAIPELQVAFNDKWQPVEWFAKNAWARIKIDVIDNSVPGVTDIKDWKSGKIRDGEYDEQLELYGLTGLLMFPDREKAIAELHFPEIGVTIPRSEYLQENRDQLRNLWESRVSAMLDDVTFEYTPNTYCRYCHFRKTNGGPCTVDI